MGETNIFKRAGVAAAVLATAALLTSCSQLGAVPGAAPTSTAPVEASPIATPVESTAPPVATADPVEPQPTLEPSTAADGRAAVVPFITSAEPTGTELLVAAIVPEVVEGDGTCTVTATKGGTTRTADGSAVAASSYTGCEALTLTGLSAGAWQVRVQYDSPTAAGASAVRTVTVG